MAGLEEALERLAGEAAFRRRVAEDPKAALADYDLTGEDIERLESALSSDAGRRAGVRSLFESVPADAHNDARERR